MLFGACSGELTARSGRPTSPMLIILVHFTTMRCIRVATPPFLEQVFPHSYPQKRVHGLTLMHFMLNSTGSAQALHINWP